MLVSYCVKCYNQARYIETALKSAFAQMYQPLEIIICDDASTDGSDKIIRRMVDECHSSGGAHRVRYYRNEKNLGNLGNWQHMCELAQGKLLIKADGDDYSKPERVARLVSAWVADGKRTKCIYSDGWAVDDARQTLWPISLNDKFCIGAFEAYDSSCCFDYPPTVDGLGHDGADDVVYLNRSRMLGPILHVPEPLVYYRQGSGETSCCLDYKKMQTRGFLFMEALAKQLLVDLEHIRERLSEEDYRRFQEEFEFSQRHHGLLRELWLGETLGWRFKAFRSLRKTEKYPL